MPDINGYRTLSDEEIQWINECKMTEVNVGHLWKTIAALPDVDPRWLSVAKTHFEQGFMAMARSIARPVNRF